MNDDINVEMAINNFIDKIKANPLIIHSERDLQAILYNELISQDSNLYTTNIFFNSKKLNTLRIHTEYKHDLVVFSKEHIKDIKEHDFHLYVGKDLDVYCNHLIELKFDISDPKSIEKTAWKDFKKLRDKSDMYFQQHNKRPMLYFIYYLLWDIKKEDARVKYLQLFKKFLEETQEEPIINYYLLIGPKNNWKDLIGIYREAKFAHLEFFL